MASIDMAEHETLTPAKAEPAQAAVVPLCIWSRQPMTQAGSAPEPQRPLGACARRWGAPGRPKVLAHERIARRGRRAWLRRHRAGWPHASRRAIGALTARADQVDGDAAREFRLLEER